MNLILLISSANRDSSTTSPSVWRHCRNEAITIENSNDWFFQPWQSFISTKEWITHASAWRWPDLVEEARNDALFFLNVAVNRACREYFLEGLQVSWKGVMYVSTKLNTHVSYEKYFFHSYASKPIYRESFAKLISSLLSWGVPGSWISGCECSNLWQRRNEDHRIRVLASSCTNKTTWALF